MLWTECLSPIPQYDGPLEVIGIIVLFPPLTLQPSVWEDGLLKARKKLPPRLPASRTVRNNSLVQVHAAAAAAKSLQSCPTLCDPINGSPPGSPVPGILQARTLEWVAISFSNAWKWKVKGKSLSHVWLLATPWTAAHQAPLSMGFSRQESWSGVPLPSPVQVHSLWYFVQVL